jgi:hypothetical protein
MYEENIVRGMERLTEVYTDEWMDWVDWSQLRMENYSHCVAGQIGGHENIFYEGALREIKVSEEEVETFGFDVPLSDLPPTEDDSFEEVYASVYGTLTQEWKDAVISKRADMIMTAIES